MAATGLNMRCEEHAAALVEFGKAMLTAAAEVVSPISGQPLSLRVGIHSGRVMSGIVGSCRARYCLFGDTGEASRCVC